MNIIVVLYLMIIVKIILINPLAKKNKAFTMVSVIKTFPYHILEFRIFLRL